MDTTPLESDIVGICNECMKKNTKDSLLFKPRLVAQSASMRFCSKGHFWITSSDNQPAGEPNEKDKDKPQGKLVGMGKREDQ